jgi:hypothetical protein
MCKKQLSATKPSIFTIFNVLSPYADRTNAWRKHDLTVVKLKQSSNNILSPFQQKKIQTDFIRRPFRRPEDRNGKWIDYPSTSIILKGTRIIDS